MGQWRVLVSRPDVAPNNHFITNKSFASGDILQGWHNEIRRLVRKTPSHRRRVPSLQRVAIQGWERKQPCFLVCRGDGTGETAAMNSNSEFQPHFFHGTIERRSRAADGRPAWLGLLWWNALGSLCLKLSDNSGCMGGSACLHQRCNWPGATPLIWKSFFFFLFFGRPTGWQLIHCWCKVLLVELICIWKAEHTSQIRWDNESKETPALISECWATASESQAANTVQHNSSSTRGQRDHVNVALRQLSEACFTGGQCVTCWALLCWAAVGVSYVCHITAKLWELCGCGGGSLTKLRPFFILMKSSAQELINLMINKVIYEADLLISRNQSSGENK